MTLLDQHIAAGSEGLMLHHQDAVYKSGRSGELLKLKRFDDAEAIVLEHTRRNGTFTGMLGAIVVSGDRGKEFNLAAALATLNANLRHRLEPKSPLSIRATPSTEFHDFRFT
jgi:DNA ligase-1